jgi:TM2 domain-containing membrane protein YozV
MERFPSEGKNKSQALALILALIVGVIGIHRFYLGYTAIGILQIYTSGLCLIWTLYDIIQIATGNLKPRYGEYHEELDKQKKSPN